MSKHTKKAVEEAEIIEAIVEETPVEAVEEATEAVEEAMIVTSFDGEFTVVTNILRNGTNYVAGDKISFTDPAEAELLLNDGIIK